MQRKLSFLVINAPCTSSYTSLGIRPIGRDSARLRYRDANLQRRDKWPEYLSWMVDTTRRFWRAFAPRLKLLNLDADKVQQGGGTG